MRGGTPSNARKDEGAGLLFFLTATKLARWDWNGGVVIYCERPEAAALKRLKEKPPAYRYGDRSLD